MKKNRKSIQNFESKVIETGALSIKGGYDYKKMKVIVTTLDVPQPMDEEPFVLNP